MEPNIYLDPLPEYSKYYLNGNAGMVYAGDFYPSKGLYQSKDPRTIDVPRNFRMSFDRPPYQTPNTQPQQHLYSAPGNSTGFYDDYKNIRAGQVIYYTDVERADPYSTPPYIIPSETIPTLLKDPMGALRPYYEKVPLFQEDTTLSEYSFDRDQMTFREDLMSKQQQKINSQQWDTFQLFNNPKEYFPSFPADQWKK
jgi:hypothetical protein